jgi:hypothetical protein
MRFRIVVIAMALSAAFTSGSQGQSQEPRPSTAEARQQEQAKPAETNHAATASEQKSSSQQPIIVHVEPIKKTEAEAEEDRRERKEKAHLDRRLVDLTAELSTYTGGLYSATVVLAIATVALVIATVGLVVMAILQSRDTKASFIATHRPKVIVRFIQGPVVDEKMTRFAYVNVVNVGVNPAIIEEFGGDIAYRNAYDWLPPGLDASPKKVTPVTLASGQRHMFTVSARNPVTEVDIFAESTLARFICIVGSIKYRDDQGVVRETAFFRTYDERNDTLIVSKKAEEEYQD